MEGGGAFGSSGATGDFQLQSYLTKPEVILRIVGWVFSIVVFGCIASQGWVEDAKAGIICAYNGNSGACGYGTAVGVIAFLGLMVFLISDAMFDNLSNAMQRKYIVLVDIAFSGLWTFMWFVCFCFLTDMWRKTPTKKNKSGNEAAIAFSFFSILIFAGLTALAVRRYRQGIVSDFHTGYDPDIFGEGQPQGGPSDAYQGSDYRQSPFADPSPAANKPAPGGYQAQSY